METVGLSAPDVSPDGRTVLLHVDVATIQIFEQAVAGGAPRQLTPAWQRIALPHRRLAALAVASAGVRRDARSSREAACPSANTGRDSPRQQSFRGGRSD